MDPIWKRSVNDGTRNELVTITHVMNRINNKNILNYSTGPNTPYPPNTASKRESAGTTFDVQIPMKNWKLILSPAVLFPLAE